MVIVLLLDVIEICSLGIRKGVMQLSTKENILALFETNKGIFFSGEEIAAQLSVSRAAV